MDRKATKPKPVYSSRKKGKSTAPSGGADSQHGATDVLKQMRSDAVSRKSGECGADFSTVPEDFGIVHATENVIHQRNFMESGGNADFTPSGGANPKFANHSTRISGKAPKRL